ncbi:hypothetical protein GC173_12890 [bacterium]|nr:hypothetical protein [bacterium]
MRHLFLALLLLVAVWAPAEETAAPKVDTRWLSTFEQSYGTEGLYVLEVKPTDPGGQSRLDLQLINAAAQQYRLQNPGKAVTIAALDEAKLLAEVHADRRADYVWNAEQKLFVSSRGPAFSPAMSVVQLLEGNDRIRRRLLEPDTFTRERWKKLYNDPESPEFLKREVLLREFILDNTNFPDALLYERSQQQLTAINDAVHIYALAQKLGPNDPVTFADLRDSGMFDSLGPVPDNVEFNITTAGAKATGTINGVPIVEDPSGPAVVRRNRAERLLKQRPDYPPALAFAARFRPPDESIKLLNRAIEIWPDVPGLRVERLAAHARRRNFAAWTPDLDFLLRRFPAAPLLIEVDVAAENGRISDSPKVHADIILMLADVRPDLLTHQLMALRLLEKAQRLDEARTVYDRLVFANPAWRVALTPPAETKTQ